MEEVLNSKVSTTLEIKTFGSLAVEEVLNNKVSTTQMNGRMKKEMVEEVIDACCIEDGPIGDSHVVSCRKVVEALRMAAMDLEGRLPTNS